MGEQVALYSALPLLPYPEEFVSRAAEGVRTNMRDVFDAVVLQNPFPAGFFSEEQWNQMVLKAVFTSRPLYTICGIDDRCNARLAEMLLDFAHERWAAGRKVTPELWRCVAPYVTERNSADIQKLSESPDELEQLAAALVLKKTAELSWDDIGKRHLSVPS
jgi:hypothetical protein